MRLLNQTYTSEGSTQLNYYEILDVWPLLAVKRLIMSKFFATRKVITVLLFVSAGVCIGCIIGLVAANYQHNSEYAYNSLFTVDRAIDGLIKQVNSGFPIY